MRSYLKLAAVLALLAACGEGPLEPGPFTLTGSWLGRAFPYELALQLQQDNENNVTGQGELRSLRELLETDTISLDPFRTDTVRIDTTVVQRVPVDVEGEWAFPDFVLTLRAEDFADVDYRGRYGRTSPDSVTGTLQGSGFQNASVPIIRRAAP
jgi:hypothetical protein